MPLQHCQSRNPGGTEAGAAATGEAGCDTAGGRGPDRSKCHALLRAGGGTGAGVDTALVSGCGCACHERHDRHGRKQNAAPASAAPAAHGHSARRHAAALQHNC
eukprot:5397921-Pleurochrysis_carterae.AAC.1